MAECKLSSEEVPSKFAEWLLDMGCPPDSVPSDDKMAQMCRGQYYMVWRSLMEHVQAKEIIRQKRLQVFSDDVRRCKHKNVFTGQDTIVEPEELTLWKQQNYVRERVGSMEARVAQARLDLKVIMDKVSTKMSQRNLVSRGLQDAQRRVWLMQQVTEELRSKRANLEQTRSIAESMCCVDEDDDIQGKLDKCISSLQRPSDKQSASVSLLASNPVASSSVVSASGDNGNEEHISSVVKCRGDALWPLVCVRRAALVSALAAANTSPAVAKVHNISDTPQAVLTHTTALHCSLALEATKTKALIRQANKRLATAVSNLSEYLSGDACELLVVTSERSRAAARLASLRDVLRDVGGRGGVFAAAGGAGGAGLGGAVSAADKAIAAKRDELQRLISSLAITERKIHNVRECLLSVFDAFHQERPDGNTFRGTHLEMPQESIPNLKQFYEERKQKKRNKVELSMELDVSECSFTDIDNSNPRFVDELKVYLKKFSLEKNRKLVLESGEQIWIFETLQSSLERLHTAWQSGDVTTSLICPSLSIPRGVKQLTDLVDLRNAAENTLKTVQKYDEKPRKVIDITSQTEEESVIMDKMKKCLNENITNLQKINKSLDLGEENMKFWTENVLKKYVSTNRSINGKRYREFEEIYLDNLSLNL